MAEQSFDKDKPPTKAKAEEPDSIKDAAQPLKINERPKDDQSGDEEQKQADSPSLSIKYMGFGGRAEPLRMAAYLSGISYRDAITSFPTADDKKAGKMRWSGLPEVVFHDKEGNDVLTLGLSNVTLSAIGKLGGKMYPKGAAEASLVDEILAAVEEIFPAVVVVLKHEHPMFLNDQKKAAELAKKCMDAEQLSMGDVGNNLPYWTGRFEARFNENEARGNKNGFFVGDSMTVADLKYYVTLKTISALESFPKMDVFLKPFPKVAAFWSIMNGNEEIKKFEAAFAEQQKKTDQTEFIWEGKNVYIEM